MTKVHEQTLLEKLRGLPPERLAEVEDSSTFWHTGRLASAV